MLNVTEQLTFNSSSRRIANRLENTHYLFCRSHVKRVFRKTTTFKKQSYLPHSSRVRTNPRTSRAGPFGEVVKKTGTTSANPFRFSTKYQDDETGLAYYGYRYHQASTGRWLSRDPSQERGGINLYEFGQNNSISFIDLLGLWKFKNGNRDGHARATVIAEKCSDPYEALATYVALELLEIQKWLKTWKPNNEVKKDDEFTVPNTVYVNWYLPLQNPINWLFILYAHTEVSELAAQGYYVIHSSSITSDAERAQFNSPDIFGLIHVAHGDVDFHGSLQETDLNMLVPSNITLDHKLGGLKIVQCWGDELPWKSLFALDGIYYWAGHGKVHPYQLPSPGF